MTDMVNHPPHYVDSSVTIEPIEVLMYMDFCTGNAMKYVIRAGKKGDYLEDIKKAYWYLQKSHDAPTLILNNRDQIFKDKFFEFFINHSDNPIIKSVVNKLPHSYSSFIPLLEKELEAIIESSEKRDTI